MPRKSRQIRSSNSIAFVTFQRIFRPGSAGLYIQIKAKGTGGYCNLIFHFDFISLESSIVQANFLAKRLFNVV